MINGVVPANGEHQRCSVLVVEDAPTMRLLLKHVLKTEYEVRLASCVDTALQVAQQRLFDILVLGIQLGETHAGINLLQLPDAGGGTCRGLHRLYEALRWSREHTGEAGYDEYGEKPFSKAELHEALARVSVLHDVCLQGMKGAHERPPGTLTRAWPKGPVADERSGTTTCDPPLIPCQ